MRTKKYLLLIFLLPAIASLLLVSCAPGAVPSAIPDPETPAAMLPSATPTSQPTATTQPGRVLLIAPAGADAQGVQAALEELSGSAGLILETRAGLEKEEITPDIRVVVSLDAPVNMGEMAAAAPQTQFIVFPSTDLPAAGNLTIIRRRLEYQAFVAGFVSVLLSTDYRAGALLPGDGPLGASLQEAFTNGARYFCGVCAPGYPLNVYFPQVAALPVASDGPAWQAAAAGMFDNQKVEVYYLSAEAVRPEVIEYLQGRVQFDKTVLLVGDQPPPDALKAQWAATVRFDVLSGLRQVWPDVTAGKGGAVLEAAIITENPAEDLVGEGRMRLVENLIAEIKAGRIVPFTVPRE